MRRRRFLTGLASVSLGTSAGCLSVVGNESDDVQLGWFGVSLLKPRQHGQTDWWCARISDGHCRDVHESCPRSRLTPCLSRGNASREAPW
jgi:hypothetical protein